MSERHDSPPPPPRERSAPVRLCLRCLEMWSIRLILAGAVLLAVTLYVFTRTGAAKLWIVPQVEKALGAEMVAGEAYMTRGGGVSLRDVVFRAPGVDGPAGEFLSAEAVYVEIDYAGGPRVTRVGLRRPVLRISVDTENDTVNLAPLLERESGAPPPDRLPVVTLTNGRLEFGEHDAYGGYTELKRLRVDGQMLPAEGAEQGESGYSLRLTQIDAEGNPVADEPVVLSGLASMNSFVVEIENFSLASWPASTAPGSIRPLLERLNLEGGVDRARFSYTHDEAVSAELYLDRVGVSLPFAVADKPDSDRPERDARMRDVNGVIRFADNALTAQLNGWLEDLPYEVTLAYDGLSADAPFVAVLRTNDYQLSEKPDLLPFVPQAVEDQLLEFTSPTAIVDAEVSVQRRRGDDGAGLLVEGYIEFRGGTASYYEFPYEVRELSGVVVFGPDALEIVEVTGRAPNGATLLARGRFAPPGATAAVDLDIRIRDMPIDDSLVEALGPNRRSVINELFSRERWEALEAEGLTQTSAQREATRRELDLLERAIGNTERAGAPVRGGMLRSRDELLAKLDRPVFDFGGKGDVNVALHREEGVISRWTRDIDVTLYNVGALPDHFPLPMIADEFRLHIDKHRALVEAQDVRPVIGGETVVDAFVRLDTDGPEGLPRIQIAAQGVPTHPLLIRAVPDASEPDAETSVRRMLGEMNVGALLDADIAIGPRAETGEIGYDADVRTTGATASPARPAFRPDDGRTLVFKNVDAAVSVTENRVGVVLSGDAVTRVAGQGDVPAGRVTTRVAADLVHVAPPVLDITVDGAGADLAAPFEDAAWVFSRSAGRALDQARESYGPAGHASVRVGVAGQGFEGPGAMRAKVAMRDLDGLEFDWYEGRASFSADAGSVEIDAGPRAVARCRGLAGPLGFEGEPIGYAVLHGTVALPAAEDAPGEPVRDAALDLLIEDLPVESAFVSRVMEISAPEGVRDLYRQHNPRGLVAADLLVRPAAGVPNIGYGEDPRYLAHTPIVEGRVGPDTLTIDYDGAEIPFIGVTGSLLFGPGWSQLDDLRADTGDWWVRANGSIAQADGAEGEEAGVAADVTLEMSSQGLPETLVAILPPKVRQNLATLEAAVGGTASTSDLRVVASRPADPHEGVIRATGTVHATGADAVIGTQVTDADLELSFDAVVPGWFGLVPTRPIPDPSFRFEARSAFGTAAGVRYTDGFAYGQTGDAEPGRIRPLTVDRFTGAVHGGRVEGEARVRAIDPADRKSPLTYSTKIRAVSVDVEALLADLAGKDDPGAQGVDRPTGARGVLDAEVSVAGLVGRDETRRGRGVVRASGGRLVNAPTISRAIELSNLVLPVGDRVELVAADFFVDGNRLTFEEIGLLSDSVLLYGYGEAAWPDLDLDLRVRSQAVNRLPVFSDLVEGLRDELVTVTITGSVRDPVVGAQSLSTTRQVLAGFLGIKPSASERRLSEIFARVRERLERGEGIAGRGADTPRRRPERVSRAP